MPKIFSKDCKVTLIEYGACPNMNFKQIQGQIAAFIRHLLAK